MIFLAGRDENGKTRRVEQDGSPHVHKTKQQSQQQPQQQQNLFVLALQKLEGLEEKVDRVARLVYAISETKTRGEETRKGDRELGR